MRHLLNLVRKQQEDWKERQIKLGKVTSKPRAASNRESAQGRPTKAQSRLRPSSVEDGLVLGQAGSHQAKAGRDNHDTPLSTYPIVLLQ